MKTGGYIRQAYSTEGRNYLLLEVDELPAKVDERISVTIAKAGKRSLDANSYHWVLVGKMATVLHTDSTSVHYQLMLDYGTNLTDEDDVPVVALLPSYVDPTKLDGFYGRLLGERDGLKRYLLIKPSRYYTKAEMARLLNGTVQAAKDLDIETLTPAELHSMGIG